MIFHYPDDAVLFERSVEGRRGVAPPPDDITDIALDEAIPKHHLRQTPPPLPELSEHGVVRHYTRLSQKNFSVDTTFYPLGSCTMKYNPKINEDMAALEGFAQAHPYQPADSLQGTLQLYYELGEMLKELTGLGAVSLQPAAGAHGELTSLMIARAYFRHLSASQGGRSEQRNTILIPDTAHGTNPASASRCGFRTVQIPSNAEGCVDLEALGAALTSNVAVLMITNPNTLGLFERDIVKICDMVHAAGGLVFLDGANFNALIGVVRPGDFGVDLMHLNLHKTFSTPHGGGGPGAGPICVREFLEPFLPVPRVTKNGERYALDYDAPLSIGSVRSFFGNMPVIVKAYCYLRSLGAEGLRKIAEQSVLNANYLCALLRDTYELPYKGRCMHEFVVSARPLKGHGIRALDVAKMLLDYGFHPPTIYFPPIVPEAMMIEPTETESKETLDAFAAALIEIARIAETNPDALHAAPQKMPARRLDEFTAARNPILRWQDES
jgi:glycine dehydrogenase subunit 2